MNFARTRYIVCFLFFIYFFSFRREIIGGMGERREEPFRFFFLSFLSKIPEKQLLFLLLFCTMQIISIIDPLKKQLLF